MATNTKDEKEIEESKAPLISHLIELRDRLKWAVVAFFIAFLVSYFFKEHIYGFLVKPLAEIYQEMGVENPRMIYTGLTEAFFTYLKVSFYAGLFIEVKNSALFLVFFSLEFIKSIASMLPIGAIIRLNTFIFPR